jgi:Mn-dependent DtxR family transcriptional regulator
MPPGPAVSDSDTDYLKWVNETDKPFATPSDVLDRASVKRAQVNTRLDRLVNDGKLQREKVGSGKVYWLTDAGRRDLD